MAKKGGDEPDFSGVEMNMTPMIDIVFQLIIFLMVANDMSRKEIEDLTLPQAKHAQEDKGEKEKYRIIVNLLKNERKNTPDLKVKGREMDLVQFQQFLKPEADRHREPDGPKASELYVLIRADKSSRWQDVQWVIQACCDPGIRVYKLQFATEDPKKHEK
ncbi:MAG TPA: biopolymer transporter ExbD [Planctomycetota bacterium]|nr:biopolymer transporter ExbD [Planctomycetota bacterium]